MDKIPTKKNDVFNYDIDWEHSKPPEPNLYAGNGSAKNRRTSRRRRRRCRRFCYRKLRERVDASVLLEELSVFLDEEAESFVLKLWRMIIYETLKFKSKS